MSRRSLAREWGLTKGALGPVFSAGLFGLMIGALLFGPLADRIGRKRIIIFSTLAFGLGALVTALVQDVNTPAGDPVPDRARPRRRDAERDRDDVGVQSAPPPRDHGDDHVLRLLGRRSARRPARGGPDPAFRLALGVRGRRRGAAAAGSDPGAAAAGIGALPGAHRSRAMRASQRCSGRSSEGRRSPRRRASSSTSRNCRAFRCCICSGTDEPWSRCCCGWCSS